METNIHEYAEEMGVEIEKLKPAYGEEYKSVISDKTYQAHTDERLVIVALNEGGFNCTKVDLVDVLKYVKLNMPEIWNDV